MQNPTGDIVVMDSDHGRARCAARADEGTAKSRHSMLEVLVAGVLLLGSGLCAPALADDAPFVEAGPQDGILCCNGDQRFYFNGSQVLVTTGRAGIFRSEDRGEHWTRSMSGLAGPNGAAPQPGALAVAPSNPDIVYAHAGIGQDFSPFTGLFASDDFGRTWQRRAALDTHLVTWMEADPRDPNTLYVGAVDRAGSVWKSTDGGRSVRRLGVGLGLLAVRPGAVYFGHAVPPQVLRSTDGGATMTPVPLPARFNRMPALIVSPDGGTLFVTASDRQGHRQSFRSVDGGATYVAVHGGLLVYPGSSAFDPSDPRRLYANDSSGRLLAVSTDGGLHFEILPASDDPRFLGAPREISVDARGALYVNTTGGLFRSDDGGRSFRPLPNGFQASSVNDLAVDAAGRLLVGVIHTQSLYRQRGPGLFDAIGNAPGILVDGADNDTWAVAASPTDANTVILALYGDGLVRTDNGGSSWTAASVTGGAVTEAIDSRLAFASPLRVYLVCSVAPEAGLYRSDDAGRSFRLLNTQPAGTIAVDPVNPDVFYIADFNGTTGLFKSIDGGTTLQDLGHPGSYAALAVDRGDPRVVYAGERNGQLLRSLDGGQTFSPASQGLVGAGVLGIVQDAAGTLYAWMRGGGLFASRDGAATWQSADSGESLRRSGGEAGRTVMVADPLTPGRLYLGHDGVIQVTTAAGAAR